MVYKILLALLASLLLASSPAVADNAFGSTGPTVTLAVTGTTGRAQFQPTPSSPNVRIYNSGTVAVFIVCGDISAVATVAAGMPIAPSTVNVLSCPQTHVAAISGGTAATIYLTPGAGL
jgi:hypothetical protein